MSYILYNIFYKKKRTIMLIVVHIFAKNSKARLVRLYK